MGAEPATLLTGGDFFESPRWRAGRWYVSDFYRHTVVTVTPDGATETVLEVPGQPSGLGWMPDGSMLVVSMQDRLLLRRSPDGSVSEHADLYAVCGGPLNDLLVDSRGRAYADDFGCDLMGMGAPALSSIKRVDPDGTVTVVADDLYFPNGMVLAPDERTLTVAETAGNRITTFDVEADGSLTGRRVFAQFAPTLPVPETMEEMLGALSVGPDGCTLDAEGCVWFADVFGARVARLSPTGEILSEISAPDGLGIFACALGGEDGTTLLLCCAPDFFAHTRAGAREGRLMTVEVDVPHAGLP